MKNTKTLWKTRKAGEKVTILVWATFEEMEKMFQDDIIIDYTDVKYFTPKELKK